MNQRYKSFRTDAIAATTVTTLMSDAERSVLRNTYLLLSMCLAFSALIAGAAVMLQLPHPGIDYYTHRLFWVLVSGEQVPQQWCWRGLDIRADGFHGLYLGPDYWPLFEVAQWWRDSDDGHGRHGSIFLAMSAYALVSKRDMSFLGGMLAVGVLVAFLAGLAAFFLNIPALSLTVSAAFVLLMSGMILYETNQIVRGGETNYIIATVSLFVSIFNLFTSLLHILGFMNKSE